jgi:hypothetical protein
MSVPRGAADVQRAPVEVDVLPLEAEHFAGTHSGHGQEPEHRFVGLPRSRNDFADFLHCEESSFGLDLLGKPTGVPYAQLGDPQSLNLYTYVGNNPLSRSDPDGHSGLLAWFWTWLTGGTPPPPPLPSEMVMVTPMMPPESEQQQKTAPANSRTDVVLHGRAYSPTPNRTTAFFWTMEWMVSACSAKDCSKQTEVNLQQTITLVESKNGGPWEPTGDPMKGVAHDQISPEGPRSFNQHWFVDGKQVKLVVGRDATGNLIQTWEVHVVVNKTGDRPVYSPVP